MELTKEKIAELKAQFGDVYRCDFEWLDKENKAHSLSFVYKKPIMANLELFQKESEKSPSTAQQNLLTSVLVYPSASEVLVVVQDYPTVIANFITEEVSPFFGKEVTRRSSKL